eukprot:g3909.t1
MSIRPLKSLLKDQQLLRTCAYIGGEWIGNNAKEVFDVLNPVDGSLVSTVARSRDSDVDTAIEHADSAGKTWSKTLASERAVILNNCSHPKIRKVSFTGSTAVAKTLLKQCSSTMKRVSLEAGGNAPFIVFKDADIDSAVQGQTCVCANRVYVQDEIYEAFLHKLTEEVKKFQIGNGAAEGVNIGPLINAKGVQKVQEHVEDALNQGARIAFQLDSDDALVNNGDNFFKPTILADVTPSMRCSYEETFGPIAPLIRFSTENEVIELANDTSAGLAAYFYTKDLGRSFRVTEALEYGMVGVNEGILSTEVAPFGGIKESGSGREGSKYGMDDYLEIKYALMGGI